MGFTLSQRLQAKLQKGDAVQRIDNLLSWDISGSYNFLWRDQNQKHPLSELRSSMRLQPPGMFGADLSWVTDVYSERPIRSLGYNVWLHKYLGFVISGTVAGLAGMLWAYYNGFVSPQDVQLLTSVETLLMVALGGPGTLAGPVLGAVLIVFLKNFVSVYTKRWLLILGTVYIVSILFAPRGLVGLARRRRA